MRAFRRQSKYISRQLHGRITLGAAACHSKPLDSLAAALLDAFLAFLQGVGQPLKNGPINVSSGVYVAKADNGTLGLRAWLSHAGAPVGLQHQTHGTWRYGVHQFVKQGFGFNTFLFCQLLLPQPEFPFEPAHHPETPIDHDFGGIVAGQCRRIRRHEPGGFHIAGVGGVDGGRGAIAHAAGLRRQTAGAENFAGFV